MPSSIALLASIALILLLVRRLHPGFAIFAGALLLSLLSLPLERLPHLLINSMLDWQTLRLMIMVTSAMTLSAAMEARGLWASLARAVGAFGSKRAIHLLPAAIGLVPMPAGAVVSASAVEEMANKLGLKPEEATYINYWFRHIWEFSIPVYQGVVVASAILGWELSRVVTALVPLTIVAILVGSGMSLRILRNKPDERGDPFPLKEFVKASWPIFTLLGMIFIGLEPALAFPLTLALLIVQQRLKPSELKGPIKYGLNPKILFMLYAIMAFKSIVEVSGSAEALINDLALLHIPPLVMLTLPSFVLGLAGGISVAFVGLAFPMLAPIITQLGWPALLLAYASGQAGYLLSPLHLCLVLSSEYFNAELSKVYRYIIPSVMGVELVALSTFISLRGL